MQDLYASWGNTDLSPQESLTYEVGFESNLNAFLFSATYFNRDVDNIIAYDNTSFKMVNKGDAKISGVEVEIGIDVTDDIDANLNYTYTKNDNPTIRIPKNKVNVNLSYAYTNKTNFSLSFQYTDERDDTFFKPDFSTEVITLDAYSLLDFSVNHKVFDDRMTLFASITNMLNEDYQEIYGFNTRGRNYNLGFRLSL